MIRRYPIVTFNWLDSSTTHGWNDEAEAEKPMMDCLAAGFLVRETADYYMIADAVTDETDDPGVRDHPWHCPQAIPKVVVSNFRVLLEAE